MSTHVVDVEGLAAHSFCNGAWRLVRKAADGSPLWDGTGWYDDTLVHTRGGWRICGRICRITGWTGSPSVNEGIPGVKFDLAASVLQREADAGRIDPY